MTCENCEVVFPGKLIKIKETPQGKVCAICGKSIALANPTYPDSKWDQYFHSICVAVASKSPCLSRKIGAILVRDRSIVSTGFNGPSRGIPHCGNERLMKDKNIGDLSGSDLPYNISRRRLAVECPRKVYGYESGTHMELCPAQHAEENAISNAARLGVSVFGSTLYMNCVIPCKNCFGTLINAGIVEIVVNKTDVYDKHTQYLIDNSSIKIRRFEI